MKNITKEVEKFKGDANKAIYNKVLIVLNGAYRAILQLMKLLSVNIRYNKQIARLGYMYLNWLLSVWRAGSGITMGYSQEQE